MPKKQKIFLIFILIFFLALFLNNFTYGQERELEVTYPRIGTWWPETVEQTFLPEYLIYIFNLIIIISGLIVFGALIYGGVRWMTSAGNPGALADAKNQILSAFLGLTLLLASYLILKTIDPKLVVFDLPKLLGVRVADIPGVYLSPEENFPSDEQIEDGEKLAFHITYNVPDIKSMFGIEERIRSLKIVNVEVLDIEGEIKTFPLDFSYGTVIHEKTNYQGDCQIYRSLEVDKPRWPEISPFSPSPKSITVFQEDKEKSEPGKEVEVYICKKPDLPADHEDCKQLKISPLSGDLWEKLDEDYKNNVWSIKMEGNFLLVLRGRVNRSEKIRCEVFIGSVSDLKEYEINTCSGLLSFWFWIKYRSCAIEYALFPIYRQ